MTKKMPMYSRSIYTNKISDKLRETLINNLSKKCHKLINKDLQKIIYEIDNCKLTIFNNNSILIQGKNIVNLVKKLNLPYVNYADKSISDHIASDYIGCDEVGTGDYFGGFVCCAAYINNSILAKLKEFKITDSKKIKDNDIFDIAPKLMKLVKYECKIFYPNEYNLLYQQYHNINILKTYGHDVCISCIKSKNNLTNKRVVMDEYCSKQNYDSYLDKLSINSNDYLHKVDIFETKAESKYIAVAIASIIARYQFLLMIDNLLHLFNTNVKINSQKIKSFQLGSTRKKIIKSNIDLIINNFGKEELKNYIKLNFEI